MRIYALGNAERGGDECGNFSVCASMRSAAPNVLEVREETWEHALVCVRFANAKRGGGEIGDVRSLCLALACSHGMYALAYRCSHAPLYVQAWTVVTQ